MADDERRDEKSLELPSLGSVLRRRRPRPPEADASPDRTPEPAAVGSTGVAPPVEPAAPPGPPESSEASGPSEPSGPSGPSGEGPPLAGTSAPSGRRRRRLPYRPRLRRRLGPVHVPGPLAALVTGAVVGLVLVGLTAASLRACSSVRGTSSCGKPGLLLLLAITVLAVVLGALLLRVSGVAASGSTSLLGAGLLVVLILLALLPVLDEWWVVVVVPLVAMLTYLVSWWVTTTYAEPGERPH